MISRRHLVVTASLLLAAGCSDSGPTEPEEQPVITHTVDAENWAFVSLGATVTPVTLTLGEASASTVWDLGFQSTNVRVNGGTGGPGGVKVYCVCQNNVDAMNAAQIMALTAEGELGDFAAVTAANIPTTPSAWEVGLTDVGGAFSPASDRWYRYNLDGNHTLFPTFQVYLVKKGSDVYKLQLIGFYGPAGDRRQITFRYAKL